MYSFKIQDGDIVLDGNGSPKAVTRAELIRQELAAWLLEPFGSDPYFPQFGSRLKELIGEPLTDSTMVEIKAEVTRVVTAYMAYQARMIRDSQNRQGTQNFVYVYRPDDIITDISNISVTQAQDAVKVKVTVSTAGGQEVSIVQEVY